MPTRGLLVSPYDECGEVLVASKPLPKLDSRFPNGKDLVRSLVRDQGISPPDSSNIVVLGVRKNADP